MTARFKFRLQLRYGVTFCLAGALAVQSVSCGTILHPERRGFRSNRLDPAIVALDGIGLLFFFVPGIIAFAVDFSTGAIYLPPDEVGQLSPDNTPLQSFTHAGYCPAPYDHAQIESLVYRKTGKSIDLSAPAVQVIRLNSVNELPQAVHDAAVPDFHGK